MKVEIWSDVVCPWCYVGKRRFESALSQFEHRDQVEVRWRAFELDPAAPRRREGDYAGRLAAKYGVGLVEARAMIERMTAVGAQEGLALAFDAARPGNTFDAHRLTHLAADRGVEDAVVERLFAATFTEGEPIGEATALERIAVEAGLEAGQVRSVLHSDAYAAEVRADEREAGALGISAVPFFVFNRAFGVSGAQSSDVLREVLERAWAESRAPALKLTGEDAPGCADEGCAV